MKKFPPFRIIFNSFGIFISNYDSITDKFVTNRKFIVYSSILTLSLQLINFFNTTSDIRNNVESNVMNFNHTFLSKFVFKLDFILLFVLSLSTIVNISVHRKRHTKILNYLVKIDAENGFTREITLKTRMIISLMIVHYCVGPPLSEMFNHRLFKSVEWLYLMSLYSVLGQYYIGHVYEFVLIERLCDHFTNICVKNDDFLTQKITIFNNLWGISKKFTKLFEVTKIPVLLAVAVQISIYSYYHYDFHYCIFSPLIWQTLVSIIFVICHSWHRLGTQVSAMQLKINFN